MRELVLLIFLLAASASPPSQAEPGCRAATDVDRGEVAACGETGELDAGKLQAAAAAAAGATPPSPRRTQPADVLASGSKPTGPADRENVPMGRRY